MRGYQDFLHLADLLTEEERMVYDTVHDFVEKRIRPEIADWYESGTFPVHLIPEMGELGLLGATVDRFGGAGLSNVAYGLINQELERGDSGIRSFASVQSALVIYPILTFGSPEQQARWVPDLIAGRKVGCFGLTEPDFGSNPGGMRTRAVRSGDHWVLNGAKMWITNGSIADVAVVWAKTDDGIMGFLVEKGLPGFTAPEIHHKMSLRASVTSELVLEDVEVPESNRLPKAHGLKCPLMCLTQARYGIGWGAIGAAMDCYETAVTYAGSRIQFDVPIARFQLVQKKLADMLTELTKAQLLALQVGRLKDAGKVQHTHVSMLKMNNVAMALTCARTARDILGANGISLEYPVIRHMCNLESVKTYEGTHDIHTLVLGQHITGLAAYEVGTES